MKKLSELRLTIGAMMMWEMVMNKPFTLSGQIVEIIVLMWCIRHNAGGFDMDIDTYIKYVEEHEQEWTEAVSWLTEQLQQRAETAGSTAGSKSKKKVV